MNVQMNEFPEGHVKVPSWEFVHFAHCQKLLLASGRLSGKLFLAKNEKGRSINAPRGHSDSVR